MILARMLGEVEAGQYFIALVVVFLLKIVSDMGVDLAFVKQYPEETEEGKSNLLKSAFAIRVLSCTLVTLLYLLVERSQIISFVNDISHLTLPTLILYWMHSFRELLLRLLQAEKIFTVYAGVQVLAAILKVALVLSLLLLAPFTVGKVLGIEILSFGASIAYAAYRIKDKLLSVVTAKLKGGIELLKFGYPLYLNAVLNLGNERVSQYIVAGFGGPIAMAFFGFAERLADAGTRLFDSFANVYYPTQTNHFAKGEKSGATHMAEKSLMWVSFVITSAIVGFTILREPVMLIFFSEKYLSAANAAAMFFGVLLFRSTQTLMGYYGVAAGMKFLPVRVSLVSSVVNIILCLYLFKKYDYEGAIAALVVTQLLMNALYYTWLRKAGFIINIKPAATVCAICAASVVVVYLLSEKFIISLFVFPVFVALCLVALPELRKDLLNLSQMTREFLRTKSDKSTPDNA